MSRDCETRRCVNCEDRTEEIPFALIGHRCCEHTLVSRLLLQPSRASHIHVSRCCTSVPAEAHAIDFEGDLYGVEVDLTFEGRLRGEQRFESVDALQAQIARDVDEARTRLGA